MQFIESKIKNKINNINQRTNDDKTVLGLLIENYLNYQFSTKGADPNEPSKYNFYQHPSLCGVFKPLIIAMNDMDLFELLLNHGANPNVYDPNAYYKTPLKCACSNNNLELCKQIVKNGADVNFQEDVSKNTVLHCAAEYGYLNIIEYLLEVGANPNICNSENETAVCIAINKEKIDILKILLKHGANPNIYLSNISDIYQTPLQWACYKNNLELCKCILENGGDVNFQDDKLKNTALHVVAYHCHVNILKYLLEAGADPNICNAKGESVLYKATYNYNNDIIDELFKYL